MKILIAIMCCHERQEYAEASRQTWIKDIRGADYKIFYGRGNHDLKDDEIQLDVPDGYYNLITKIYGIVQWAYSHGYDYILKCDDDVYVLPARLVSSDFSKYDFIGGESFGIDECNRLFRYQNTVLAPGGCWWLSRKSMQAMLSRPQPGEGADEPWVADVLKNSGIPVRIDNRIGCYGNIPEGSYEFVHCSLPNASSIIASYEYNPAEMLAEHDKWKIGIRTMPSEVPAKQDIEIRIGSCHFKNLA